jgi:hypothetical protein
MKTKVLCSWAGKSPRRLIRIPWNHREISAGNQRENRFWGSALCSTDWTKDWARSLARGKRKIPSAERGGEKSRAMVALVRDEKQENPQAGNQIWLAHNDIKPKKNQRIWAPLGPSGNKNWNQGEDSPQEQRTKMELQYKNEWHTPRWKTDFSIKFKQDYNWFM